MGTTYEEGCSIFTCTQKGRKFKWKPNFNPLACCKDKGQMLEVGQVSFSWFPWYLTLVRWCLKNFWIPLARENARSRSYGASKVRVWWMKFGSISKLLNSSTIKVSVLPHHKGLQAILPSWKRGWWRRPSRQALALVLLWSDPSVRWEHSSTNLLISSTSWETACW